MRIAILPPLVVACVACSVAVAAGQSGQSRQSAAEDQTFKRLSIEQLANIDVTSVSKHAERIIDAAAAISVLTQDDLRRAGITTLPDALRLATGLTVARFDGHTWAISARGFNISTANKLVVLIDGRSVYTPLFSGVQWDVQDLVLSDIDRIEIIRGPGGALWGANAMNGVINIITKATKDTLGGAFSVGGGSDLGQVSLRHGGRINRDTTYRAYGKYEYHGEMKLSTGADGQDPLRRAQTGFRIDRQMSSRLLFTFQGDLYKGLVGIADRPDSDVSGGNLLGRLTQTRASGAQLQFQWYYDRTFRNVPRQYAETRDTVDFDLQFHAARLGRHDVVTGAGYQVTRSVVTPSVVLFFDPPTRTSPLTNVFIQDDITIVPSRFHVIAGIKVEHNDYTGWEYQPTIRARYTLRPGHTLWGAVSRAVHMPTRFDTDLRFTGFAPIVILSGNPSFKSENLLASEIGYRQQMGTRLSLDAVAFVNRYADLRSQEPTPPAGLPITLRNLLSARTSGVSFTVDAQPVSALQLHVGYSFLSETFTPAPGSLDPSAGSGEHNDPRHQLWVRSFLNLPGSTELDATIRFVGALPNPKVPSYTELTLHFGWRPNTHLEWSLIGDNLLHKQHPEFGGLVPRAEFARSVFGQLTWRS